MQQFLTVKKCQSARDKEAEDQAKTSNPSQCLAMEIKGLDEEKWKMEVPDHLRVALKAKFIQNAVPRKFLRKTRDRKILYCDSEDPFLGTGFPLIDLHETYPGQNLLGEILMEIRSELLENPAFLREIEGSAVHKKVKFNNRLFSLSNQYTSMFQVNGEKFNSVEQYLAVRKSQLAGDKEAEEKIRREVDPLKIRHIVIQNLTEENWLKVAQTFLQEAIQAKFQQNKDLRMYLLKTYDAELQYWVKEDPFLGTGLDMGGHHRSFPGLNLLGSTLMEVRAALATNSEFMQEVADSYKVQYQKRKQDTEEEIEDKKLKID